MKSSSAATAIRAREISHIYDDAVEAIKAVNLTIVQGEAVGIIGMNGSGKTTLVKHFNGLLKPTSGDVVVNGISTKDQKISELSKHVGYVFQNPDSQLFLNSVLEEAKYGPQNIGMSEDEQVQITERVLRRFGLWDLRDAHPFSLSRLNRRLLSIASVLTMKPEIIIFDEPTTGQDIKHTSLIREITLELSEQGTTLIVVSHDMSFVAECCTRVIVLSDGRIIADGSPREVFYRSAELARAGVNAPDITRIATEAGIEAPILRVSELVRLLTQGCLS